MVFLSPRPSIDSDANDEQSLLNNTLLDDESFIGHVSQPLVEDFVYDDGVRHGNYWTLSFWRRIFPFLVPKGSRQRTSSRRGTNASWMSCDGRVPGRRKGMRRCMILGLGGLILLGIVEVFTLLGGLVAVLFPDDIGQILESWGQIGQTGQGLSSWPTDFTRDVIPIRCHSHNDYWRRVPLYSAISAGCISVEADVWLFDEELYVGHSTSSLTRNRTLKYLYIDPIVEILEKQNPINEFNPEVNGSRNGVYDTDPSQILTLLIDFKTGGAATWPYVINALRPLRARNYLTYHNGTHIVPGPIRVVGTGNTPFDFVRSNTSNHYHDIFFDAPLDEMWEDREWEEAHGWPGWDEGSPGEVLIEDEGSAEEDQDLGDYPWGQGRHVYKPKQHKSYPHDASEAVKVTVDLSKHDTLKGKSNATAVIHPDIYTIANSHYASVAFGKAVGRMWRNRLSQRQMGLIRGQIRGAHRRGLKVRYWDLPSWPIGLRNHVWDVLMREGVDLLNVDDLWAAKRMGWRRRHGHRP